MFNLKQLGRAASNMILSNFPPNGKNPDNNRHQASTHPLQPSQSSEKIAVAIQVPVCFNQDFLKSLKCVWLVIQSLSHAGRGSRVWPELGTYMNHAGRLMFDLNMWIQSEMSEQNFNLYADRIYELACSVRDSLRQEAIAVEVVHGSLKFF